jgi:hypothetical protein
VHSSAFDDETRYQLSVCNLRLSARDLAPALRAEDHALRGFQALLHGRTFPLLDRLRAEKALEAADLYYTAFHFCEGLSVDREFGEKLLAHVAAKWPRSAEGKAARKRVGR